MKLSIFHIKLAHTIVFWVLSGCVAYTLYSGVTDRITVWTWVAMGLIVVEGLVLVAFGWICPLTLLAERLGARRGSVADIFLPKRCADQIFPVCTTLFLVGCILVVYRVLAG